MILINNSAQPIMLEDGTVLAASGSEGCAKNVDSISERDQRLYVTTEMIAVQGQEVITPDLQPLRSVFAVEWQGEWSSSTTYRLNDAVSHEGSSYVCIVAHTNHVPPDASYWQMLAGKGDAAYKTYVATLIQSGAGAPQATVIENTLGPIVWTRVGAGAYFGTLTGQFTPGKTFVCCSNAAWCTLSPPKLYWITAYRATLDIVVVGSFQGDVPNVANLGSADSLLGLNGLSHIVEIRVYP